MAPGSLRRAIGAVKDQTSIGLAKVGNSTSLADLHVAIVKATKHDEYPAEEKHMREILSLTCYSRTFISACVNILSRRLSRTSSWTVALKTLILIQRLLSEGDPAYEQEIFFATRRGTRFLNMSDFRDNSKYNSWEFSAFLRTYALYLDERLEYRMQSKRGKRSRFASDEEEDETMERESENGRHSRERDSEREMVKATPISELKTSNLFSKMQHLQLVLERFIACRPTGLLLLELLNFIAIRNLHASYKNSMIIKDLHLDYCFELTNRESKDASTCDGGSLPHCEGEFPNI